MNKPVLILMCGLPFAGKTTIARRLAAQTGWHYISLDVINTERSVGLDGNAITSDQWTESYAEANQRVHAVLVGGQSVICDDTNFLRSQRDELRTIGAQCHVNVYVVYVPTSEAEVRQRWQRNRAVQQRGDVRDEDFAHVCQFRLKNPQSSG